MPRDNDKRCPPFGLSFEPPELAENVRLRSTPGIATEVSSPCPLQKSKIDWATFAGCTAQVTEKERFLIKKFIVTFYLFRSEKCL